MTIRVSSVTKIFGAHAALNDVSLTVEAGEFFVVLGPSGCGKSTLLRAIAGLEQIDSGTISLGRDEVAGQKLHVVPEERNVGVVFQSYALWPHMSVAGNVGFPLETSGLSRREVKARAAECLDTVALSSFAERRPADLSGGQRQRVALARCLAQSAKTILMDEPLANLDPHLRSAMEEELADFHKRSGATTLFITHDQREAMALADKVAVMWDGQILQVDAPDALYRRPNSERVAGFIGRSSLPEVHVDHVNGNKARVLLGTHMLEVDCLDGTEAGPAVLLLRPEHMVPSASGEGIEAIVERTIYRGGFWEAFVSIEGLDRPLMTILNHRVKPGETLSLNVAAGWVLPK